MKISVIIPVYNGEKYIAQCIENVLCQTYKKIEIIVVNDGSTDRTAEIAAGYPAVRLINREKGGVAVARNAGIAASTGEYFHFLDVDDWINIDFYENMVDAVTATDADMGFCGFINEVKSNLMLLYQYRWVCVETEDKFSLTKVKEMGYSPRYLCRKKLVTDNRLEFPVGWMLEDMSFTLQVVFHANKVVTVPDAVYYYKKREGSSLNSKDKEHARKMNEFWKMSKQFRRDFLSSHGLEPRTVEVRPKFRYSILGIPLLWKRVNPGGEKVKWFLFGIPVLVKRGCRS
jgi:glycosyltransferase involved in cell wall biosynthesis